MAKKKRSEVCIVSPSKAVVNWKSHRESNDVTFFLSAMNYIVIIPPFTTMGILAGLSPEFFLAGGAYTAITSYFLSHAGHRKAINTVLASKSKINILDSWKASKKNRKLLESYYIKHGESFRGLITKEQESAERDATHQVKTYLVQGFWGQRIEQEIEELPEFMWDKALDAIDETMTTPAQRIIGIKMFNNQLSSH